MTMRRVVLVVIAVIALSRVALADDAVRLPVRGAPELFGSEAVARTWGDLQPPDGMASALTASRPMRPARPITSGREDVFVRRDDRWMWLGAASVAANGRTLRLPAHADRLGILLRFTNALYAWEEVDGATAVATHVRVMKSLDVATATDAAEIVVFSDDAETPRVLAARLAAFDAVPATAAIVCATAATGADCRLVGAEETEAAVTPRGAGQMMRVVRTPAAQFAITVTAPSVSALRPKHIDTTIVATAGRWIAFTVRDEDDEPVAFDFRSDGFALERRMLRDLAPLPSFSTIDPAPEHGVAVRASIRGVATPLRPGAQLLALPESGGDRSGLLPLGRATLGADGVFRFPELGAGVYRLKLLAPLAGPASVPTVLVVGDTATVAFDAGPLVKGKLELQAGGAVGAPPEVQILRTGDVPQAPQPTDPSGSGSSMRGDLADWVRTADIADDGAFATAIVLPGAYRLRARWGHGIATRDFTMKAPPEDVDLGTIALRDAATVRGHVRDCAGGEVRIMPLPDLAHPSRLTFADLRRASLVDESFVFDGVPAGSWLLGATCGGKPVLLDSGILTLVDGQEIVIDAHPTNREPQAPASMVPPK